MWLLRLVTATCLAASCATQNSTEAPPVPSVHLLTTWRDVFLSEKVKLECRISSSADYTFSWTRDGRDVTASNLIVSLAGDGSQLTVTMGEPESSSGSYTCKALHKATGSLAVAANSETLRVLGKKPQPTLRIESDLGIMYPGESITFSCSLEGSSGWSFMWEHNSTAIGQFHSTYTIAALDYSHSGDYRCQAQRGEDPFFTDKSPAISLQVSEIPKPELTPTPDWEGVFQGELVQLLCSVDSSDWSYVWYRDGVPLQDGDVLEWAENDPYLNITAAKEHEGEYSCSLTENSRKLSSERSNRARIQVYDQFPKVTLQKDPAFDTMFVGEVVNFTCSMNVPASMKYQWLKDGSLFSLRESGSVSVPLVASSGGKYSCQATRGETEVTSEERLQRVIDQKPKPSLTQQPDDQKVYTGERVNLTCNVALSTGWQYVWFKDGEPLQVQHSSFIIAAARQSHSGVYKCSAVRNQTSYRTEPSGEKVLEILEVPVPVLRPLTQWLEVFSSERVSMSCAIKGSSDWRYEWQKDGQPLWPSELVSFDSDQSVLSISGASASHAGEYRCSAVLKRRPVTSSASEKLTLSVYERPKAEVNLLTGWTEVFSTETLVLQCAVEGSHQWNYTWYKNDHEINGSYSSKHLVTPQNDPEQSLYKCKGVRSGRPDYSKRSEPYKTWNLLLKRRVLLAISGSILFGIAVTFLGCVILKILRKPAKKEYKPDENDLFLPMSPLKDSEDGPCPLVQYITEATLNSPKEGDDNGLVCSETTPLPISSPDDQDLKTESHQAADANGGLASFKCPSEAPADTTGS